MIAVYAVYGIKRETDNARIWSYVAVLLCINLRSAAHAYESFIKIKSSLEVSVVDLEFQQDVMVVILSAVRTALAFQYLYFVWLLTGKRWKSAYSHFFLGLILLVAALQVAAMSFPVAVPAALTTASVVFCHSLVFGAFLPGVFKAWVYSASAAERHGARWLRCSIREPDARRTGANAGAWTLALSR